MRRAGGGGGFGEGQCEVVAALGGDRAAAQAEREPGIVDVDSGSGGGDFFKFGVLGNALLGRAIPKVAVGPALFVAFGLAKLEPFHQLDLDALSARGHEGARVHERADGVFQRGCGGVGEGEVHGKKRLVRRLRRFTQI